jgi:hypothetical protein
VSALRGLLQDEVERGLEDVAVARAGMRVREGVAGGGELLHDRARDGDVHAGQLGGLGLDDGLRWRRRRRRTYFLGPRLAVGIGVVGRLDDLTFVRVCRRERERLGRRGDRGHHRAPRDDLCRAQLRGDLLCVALRQMEEPRENLGAVLRSEDLRQLDHARHAEPPVPERLHDFRVTLDELRRGEEVVRRAAGQPEMLVQEGEERGIPEVHPQPAVVEVCECHQKIGERVVLGTEQIGEAGGGFACGGRHEVILSCVFDASGNARICFRRRERAEVAPAGLGLGGRVSGDPRRAQRP